MATITLKELNQAQEAAEVLASGNNLVFSSDDSHQNEADQDPLTRPNGGVVRSYEKWLRIDATALDAGDLLSNFQLYMADGAAPAAGVTLQVGLVNAYAAPQRSDSTVANADLFSYTSANPLLITAANTTYGLAADDPDTVIVAGSQIGSYVVIQMDLTPQAELGVFTTNYGEIPITIRYDVAP